MLVKRTEHVSVNVLVKMRTRVSSAFVTLCCLLLLSTSVMSIITLMIDDYRNSGDEE